MLLIVYRILSISLQNRAMWKDASDETVVWSSNFKASFTAVEILVESSMLYAVSIFALFVLLASGHPTYFYAQAVVTQITVSTYSCL